MSEVPVVLNIDAADSDWIKRGAWDIWGRDGLIDNAPDLREWLYGARMTVEEFKQLTVYKAHLEDMPWLRDL